jgi:hypothetical protein
VILGRRLDRNPLRRPADRIETVVLLTLLAAFFAGAPFAARAAADWTYGHSLRVEQAEQATFRQVPAVLLHAPDISRFALAAGMSMTEVSWTAPNGRPRTGSAPAPITATAGSTVLVWITADGDLTSPPMLPSQVSDGAGLSGATAVGVLAATLAFIGWLTHWSLDRRRLAAWDADWLANGPRWTSRR